jgi:DNA-binding winged helix-turn-helix (wHTH) protein
MRLAFLGFVLDTEARELTHGEAPVRLSPKAFQLLEHLVTERPRAVSKRELMDLVWPETFVVEANLSNLVGELRVAVGDDPKAPRAIRTVSRFGYAFIAPVAETAPAEAAPAAPPSPSAWELRWAAGRVGLPPGEHTIGRGDDADVRLESSRVSRHHARLTVSRDRLLYEDLQSKNGTFEDGQRIDGVVPVEDGQTLTVGDIEVVFRRRREEQTATMAAASGAKRATRRGSHR